MNAFKTFLEIFLNIDLKIGPNFFVFKQKKSLGSGKKIGRVGSPEANIFFSLA